MISHRIPRLMPNALAGLRAAVGDRVIDLTVSNPTRVGLPLPAADIRAALDDPRVAAYEPESFGRLEAREAVCAYYAGVHGVAVEPRDVALTASTSEAYSFLLKLLADPGERVLVPTPSYPLFTHLLQLDGVDASSYGLVYDLDRWCIDLESVERGVRGGARAIIAVGPNNPTGSYLKAAEVSALDRLARVHGIAVVSDEVFADFPLRPRDADCVPTLAGRVTGSLGFSLGGLSKLLACPQLKLGWIVMSGDPAARARVREGLELVADTYLSVGTPVQVALPALLSLRSAVVAAIGRRLTANLESLRAALGTSGPCRILDAEGGWSAIVRIPVVMDADEACADLAHHAGVWVQPGYFFDLPAGHIVLSLIVEEAAFRAGTAALMARIGSW
ncbi:MAG: pyridoxal phosphate-dependent aminotransferase [Candidatus Schekmanbacteria bacterium]|nr:pyridoxal phosphate-dependent aminotransferase [Candidatus Schekmanbacteria bacterium]